MPIAPGSPFSLDTRVCRLIDEIEQHAIVSLDPGGRIVGWNRGAVRLFGFPADEALERTGDMLFTPEDRADGAPAQELERARRDGYCPDERWHVRADGTRFYASGSTSAVRGDDGDVLGFVKIAQDLTALMQLQDALRDADRRKDEFLAMLAHELRNPLSPVRSAAAVLRRSPELSPTLAPLVTVIDRQVRLLARLVDDLLDVSRITRGALNLQRRTLDLAEVVHHAIEIARPALDARAHRFEVQLSELPVWVEGDFARLTQAVANLLDNAAKYTEPHGRVELVLEAVAGHAVLRVRDDGIGIPASLRPSIFELFVQGDRSLDRSVGGLGIGLSLVRRVAELHGGTVTVDSAGAGRGSEFILSLPIANPQGATAAATPLPIDTTARRVLVVDDNVDAAESLAMLLRLEGHEVRTAHSGRQAIDTVCQWRPASVLLDIGLPGMDGYEVARRLRESPDGAGLRLVAVTGYGQPDDRSAAAAAGFDAHLVKPVSPEDVVRALL